MHCSADNAIIMLVPLAGVGVKPWLYMLLALGVSGVLVLSSHQDHSMGVIVGFLFYEFMAAVFLLAFIVNAVRLAWWLEALIGVIALVIEFRDFRRRHRKLS